MNEGRSIPFLHDGEVEFWPILEIRPQIFVAFEIHDGVDRAVFGWGLFL